MFKCAGIPFKCFRNSVQMLSEFAPYKDKHEDVARCIRYMEANISRMDYGTYIKKGMQIGSGIVESGCRSIIGERLKRPGCHWTVAGANNILALRTCFENNRWADFQNWNTAQRMAA